MTTRIGSEALAAARQRAVWFDLGPAPVVAIHGEHARRFCNGMFTNNVRDLPVGGANRSALVDDRGRIGGFLQLLCEADDRFVAILDGIAPAGFLERYEKYAMLDDVVLDDRTGVWSLLSVQGPAIDLASAGWAAPGPGRFGEGDPRLVARVRAPAGGYDVLATRGSGAEAVLDRIALRVGPEDADALRVLAGRPAFPGDTGDKRLPAEIGFRDELLSFDKGCYLGQESIHRIDVQGDVKRKLVGVRVPGVDDVAPGAPVTADGVVVGELTSPTLLPNGDLVGLAVVKRPYDAPGTAVRAGDHAGRIEALPFDPTDPAS